jgi:hypothetical protein
MYDTSTVLVPAPIGCQSGRWPSRKHFEFAKVQGHLERTTHSKDRGYSNIGVPSILVTDT